MGSGVDVVISNNFPNRLSLKVVVKLFGSMPKSIIQINFTDKYVEYEKKVKVV